LSTSFTCKECQLAGEANNTSDNSSYKLVEPSTDNMSNGGFSIISNLEAANLDEPDKEVDSNKEAALSLRMMWACIDNDLLIDILKEVLEPIFRNFVVPSPDVINHPRTCQLLQFNVPAGIHPYNFVGNGSRLKLSMLNDASHFDAKIALGSKLGMSKPACFEPSGGPDHQLGHPNQQHNEAGCSGEGICHGLKEYVMDVPCHVTIENELCDPTNWNRAGPGQKGHFISCTASNLLFYYLFFFEKENPNNVPPQNSLQNGISINVQGAVNGMGGQHRAAAQFYAYQQSATSTSCYRQQLECLQLFQCWCWPAGSSCWPIWWTPECCCATRSSSSSTSYLRSMAAATPVALQPYFAPNVPPPTQPAAVPPAQYTAPQQPPHAAAAAVPA
jgi:hypothetical protein